MVATRDITSPCQELKAQLSDYIDDDLDEGVCKELERHLAKCQNCRIVVDTLRKTILLYRNHGAPRMPAAAQERLIHVLKLDARGVEPGSMVNTKEN